NALGPQIVNRRTKKFLFIGAVEHGDVRAFGSKEKGSGRAAQTGSQNCHVLIRVTQVLTSTSMWPDQVARKSRTKSRNARSPCFLSNRRARSGDGSVTWRRFVCR